MRSIILGLVSLVAIPATAQAPEAQMRYGCFQDKLVIQIIVPEPGGYTVVLPAAVCGPSI